MPSTKRLLELAIKGLEVERERIEEELLQLRQQLYGTKGPQHAQRTATKMAAPRQKRKMSAAAKRQISKRMQLLSGGADVTIRNVFPFLEINFTAASLDIRKRCFRIDYKPSLGVRWAHIQ